ncbi:DUF3426 domain-containing protein [Pseudodesulfovibrio sp. zrk46]|uniref:DUF3426 domain-containing protein n=1 Tax=Pseudodesulfovibrio sp. zrk46 TaxID=2725288 RepID=UPI001449E653|nr:DUF3426 domain-containing protein [Pseudodesulfovibrio sp. zrk46]QJB56255.1 DUF3426 domain-containing protein [Pseudodesulfovibrio sp. zrk46]
MIVTCPNCQTRYNLPDDKVPAGGAKVKCSKCAHVFKADPPPSTPEEEVENLLEEETPAPEESADDAFDEAFDEVAAGGADEPADEPAEEPVPEDESDFPDLGDDAGEDASDDMPGMDDLFDDAEDTAEVDDTPSPAEEVAEATADDVESLFGDDESDLFADDGEEEESDDDVGDLFADDGGDDDDTSDLFADGDDDEEEDDEEYEDDDDDTAAGFALDDDEDEDKPRKKGGKALIFLIIVIVLAICVGGGIYFTVWKLVGLDLGTYFQNVPYISQVFKEETGGSDEAAPGESPAERVRKIELKNVKQYYVGNEKTGNLFVVEGKAVNKFSTPKEQIKVEVSLFDGNGQKLTSKAFLCGNVLSQFQLQVQTQKEIEDGLSSEVGILSNNTFIRPGASTPFMAVFFEPPAGVKEFLVKVVDVGDPE